MQTEQLIPVSNFCSWYNVEFSFIHQLHEFGLIEITTREADVFIPESELEIAEKLVRIHNDLQVNTEGIEVITNLLDQVKTQQLQIKELQNKLRFYEEA